MGTIAARDALRVLTLAEQVVVALLISVRQGIALREKCPEGALSMQAEAAAFLADLNARIPFIEDDVALEPLLRQLLADLRARTWSPYAPS